MKRLLLIFLLFAIGIYLYTFLYKYDYFNEPQRIKPTEQLKSILKHHNQHGHNSHNNHNSHRSQNYGDSHDRHDRQQNQEQYINDDFIEQKNNKEDNIIDEINQDLNKHVRFSEQNEEFVFTKDDSLFINPSTEIENKNINLTLSENEYFTKNL